jgi:hypothetical protein
MNASNSSWFLGTGQLIILSQCLIDSRKSSVLLENPSTSRFMQNALVFCPKRYTGLNTTHGKYSSCRNLNCAS